MRAEAALSNYELSPVRQGGYGESGFSCSGMSYGGWFDAFGGHACRYSHPSEATLDQAVRLPQNRMCLGRPLRHISSNGSIRRQIASAKSPCYHSYSSVAPPWENYLATPKKRERCWVGGPERPLRPSPKRW